MAQAAVLHAEGCELETERLPGCQVEHEELPDGSQLAASTVTEFERLEHEDVPGASQHHADSTELQPLEHEDLRSRSCLTNSTETQYYKINSTESNASWCETEDSIPVGGDAQSYTQSLHQANCKAPAGSVKAPWSKKNIARLGILLFCLSLAAWYVVSKAQQVQHLNEMIQKLQNNVTELQGQLGQLAAATDEGLRLPAQIEPAEPLGKENCTCTPKKTLGYSLLAGLGTCAVTAGVALIPGVGQAAALGAVLSAGEMAAAGILGGGAAVGVGAAIRGSCNC